MRQRIQNTCILFTAVLFIGFPFAGIGQQNQIVYHYDTIGRLIEVIYPDSSTYRYGYDRNGNILSITGTTKNAAPTSANAVIVTDEDTPAAPVTPTVADPNPGDTFTFSIVVQPAHGNAVISANKIVYTPAPDYNGQDSLVFRATDQGGLSVTGIARITVRPVNDAPESFARQTTLDGTVQQRVAIGFAWTQAADVDGDTVSYALRIRVASIDSTVTTKTLAASFDFGGLALPTSLQSVVWSVVASDGKATTAANNNDGSFMLDSVVIAKPVIVISPRTVSFGTVLVGTSKALPATIGNQGTAPLSVSDILSSSSVFTSDLKTFVVDPSASTVDSLRFTPMVEGPVSGIFTVSNNSDIPVDTIFVSGTGQSPSGVDGMTAPDAFALSGNYPNPAGTSTAFTFSLPRASHATLDVFNAVGVKVRTLMDADAQQGVQTVRWNPVDVPSGMYLVRLRWEGRIATRTMVVFRP